MGFWFWDFGFNGEGGLECLIFKVVVYVIFIGFFKFVICVYKFVFCVLKVLYFFYCGVNICLVMEIYFKFYFFGDVFFEFLGRISYIKLFFGILYIFLWN